MQGVWQLTPSYDLNPANSQQNKLHYHHSTLVNQLRLPIFRVIMGKGFLLVCVINCFVGWGTAGQVQSIITHLFFCQCPQLSSFMIPGAKNWLLDIKKYLHRILLKIEKRRYQGVWCQAGHDCKVLPYWLEISMSWRRKIGPHQTPEEDPIPPLWGIPS